MGSPPKPSVFEFMSYKKYVLHWILSRPHCGRGERSRIAETLQCQLAYISQVLNGSAHFSFEQAEALNTLLDHTDHESDFFLLLVHLERAGTQALQRRIKKKIKETLNQRLVLRNRLNFEKTLSREDQMTYYSAWYYAAIHMALAIPALQTRESLARAFNLSVSKISLVLDFFQTHGLATEERGRYKIGDARIHLENDSPMISKHHTNWRMQAIQSLEKETSSELHYSSVITVAEDDIPKVREALVKAVEKVREIIKPSKDETIFCYTLDLFRVGT